MASDERIYEDKQLLEFSSKDSEESLVSEGVEDKPRKLNLNEMPVANSSTLDESNQNHGFEACEPELFDKTTASDEVGNHNYPVADYEFSPEEEEFLKDVFGDNILNNCRFLKPFSSKPSAFEDNSRESYQIISNKAKSANSDNLEPYSSNNACNEPKFKTQATISSFTHNSISKVKNLNNLTLDEIGVEHIQEWARINLPVEFNLAWEVEKFKDYYLSTSKKKPTNFLAALRNWLRKACEFKQQQEINNARRLPKYQNRQSETNDNFYKAGARLLAKYEKRGLDRKNAG